MSEIKAGDVVVMKCETIAGRWNVSQVHAYDRSADIWRMVDGRREEHNVAVSDLARVTS